MSITDGSEIKSVCTPKSCTLASVVHYNLNSVCVVYYQITVSALAWDTGFVMPSTVKAATWSLPIAYHGCKMVSGSDPCQSVIPTVSTRTVALLVNGGQARLDNGGNYKGWFMYH